MEFVKMHGLGNDFIIINDLEGKITEDYGQLAQRMCNRNFGIGGDGLMVVLPSRTSDIKMRIFNSDGSEPEMCGNGIRCFAKYVFDQGIVKEKVINVETLAGIIVPEIIVDHDGHVKAIRVDMGEPKLKPQDIPIIGMEGEMVVEAPLEVEGKSFIITTVSMGNPHCVIFVPDIERIELTKWGPLIETHQAFPRKTNVEFAQVVNPDEIIMRVWERGAGVTLACGTGACATLVAGVLTNKTHKQATLKLAGGDLFIEWAENQRVYMTGPAVEVFRGEFFL